VNVYKIATKILLQKTIYINLKRIISPILYQTDISKLYLKKYTGLRKNITPEIPNHYKYCLA